MFDSSNEKIREAALRILDFGDCSRSEMQRKLKKKGFSGEGIDTVLRSLTESGLLDDGRYAENYIRSALDKGKGTVWIRNKLREKGVSSSIITMVFEELDTAGNEPDLCMKKALALCDLKNDFETDGFGHLLIDNPEKLLKTPDPFGRRIPEGADRREIRTMREKEKSRLVRRLAGAGFSQSAVYSVLQELEQVFGPGGFDE